MATSLCPPNPSSIQCTAPLDQVSEQSLRWCQKEPPPWRNCEQARVVLCYWCQLSWNFETETTNCYAHKMLGTMRKSHGDSQNRWRNHGLGMSDIAGSLLADSSWTWTLMEPKNCCYLLIQMYVTIYNQIASGETQSLSASGSIWCGSRDSDETRANPKTCSPKPLTGWWQNWGSQT